MTRSWPGHSPAAWLLAIAVTIGAFDRAAAIAGRLALEEGSCD